MAFDLDAMPADYLRTLGEFHVGILAEAHPDGSPHATVVGFTYVPEEKQARIVTSSGSVKLRNLGEGAPASLTQVDGRFWMTLEGTARPTTDPDELALAKARFEERYPMPTPPTVDTVIVLDIDRAYGAYPA